MKNNSKLKYMSQSCVHWYNSSKLPLKGRHWELTNGLDVGFVLLNHKPLNVYSDKLFSVNNVQWKCCTGDVCVFTPRVPLGLPAFWWASMTTFKAITLMLVYCTVRGPKSYSSLKQGLCKTTIAITPNNSFAEFAVKPTTRYGISCSKKFPLCQCTSTDVLKREYIAQLNQLSCHSWINSRMNKTYRNYNILFS